MTACTMDGLVEKAKKKILGTEGLATLRALRELGPQAALCIIVQRTTRLQNYDRATEVVHQLMEDQRIRGRLRQAYYQMGEI